MEEGRKDIHIEKFCDKNVNVFRFWHSNTALDQICGADSMSEVSRKKIAFGILFFFQM